MTDFVTVTDEGLVRILRMNRPEKKNALTQAMYAAMAQGIESAGAEATTSATSSPRPAKAANSARRSCDFSMRWRVATNRWSPPYKVARSASAPPC